MRLLLSSQPPISAAKPRSRHESQRPPRGLVRSPSDYHCPAHSECETPAGPFQLDLRDRRTAAPAQSPPEAHRIHETLPPEQRWYAPRESARDNWARDTVRKRARAHVLPRSVPTTNTRPY